MIHDEFLLKRHETNPIIKPRDFKTHEYIGIIGLATGSLSEMGDARKKEL